MYIYIYIMETRQDRERLIDNVKNWIDLDE